MPVAAVGASLLALFLCRPLILLVSDVADTLNNGKLAAAGLDVVYTEPIKSNNPLLKAKNCIITLLISWTPIESSKRIMSITADNIKAFLSGKPINVVNG
ncbi:MAG: NAD(P)-dependent oxidoreductase [Sphaerochaetaceae bacterium]